MAIKKLFFLMLPLFSAVTSYAQTIYGVKNSEAITEYNQSGVNKLNSGDYVGAITDLTKAIDLEPLDVPFFYHTYYTRGNAKFNLEDYRGAIADFTKDLERSPYFTPAYYHRGASKYRLEDYRGAISDFSKTTEFNTKYIEAYTNIIYKNLYQLEEVYLNRGNAKQNLKDYQGAITDFNKALEINPKFAEVYHSRGLAKLALGQKNSGCLDLSKAGELGFYKAYDTIKEKCN